MLGKSKLNKNIIENLKKADEQAPIQVIIILFQNATEPHMQAVP